MAGLLPSQRTHLYCAEYLAGDWAGRLEKIWAACGETATMSEDDWRFFKVRPGNLPVRRIAAMSHLLLRYRGEGIMAGLIGGPGEAAIDTGCHEMERALLVTAGSHKGLYGDSGQVDGSIFPALLGRGRAADIVVNVLLPFAVALGQAGSHPELAEQALEIYRNYPVLTENTLERHMRKQLGINRYLVNSARRQQGLLHIYKTLCSQGKCRECPIGRGELLTG